MILAGCSAGTSTSSTTGGTDAVSVPADGVEFNIVAKEGDTITYQAKMTMDGKGPAQAGMPSEFNVTADMKQTVKVTKIDGEKITTETSFSDVNVTGTEMFANLIKASLTDTKNTATIDKKGRVLEQTGQMDANSMSGGTLFFPDEKVKVGDTWERSAPMAGGANVKAIYKFEGTEKLDGMDVARISVTPEGEANATGSFMYWIDMATGMAVKANGEVTQEADGGKMVMTLDIKRV